MAYQFHANGEVEVLTVCQYEYALTGMLLTQPTEAASAVPTVMEVTRACMGTVWRARGNNLCQKAVRVEDWLTSHCRYG